METTLPGTDRHTELREWTAQRVASYLECSPAEIDPEVPLTDYGLSSVYAFVLCGDLEDHLGFPIDPTVVWDHRSIEQLSAHLVGLAAAHRADCPGATP
ncbi:acyl carrier protein [Streptomyces sp. DT24]|uniref:acyl carrier protein n=1 Tax=unclassified Streptomyces TaxID=2593676 RepID=UPI0023B988BE|nr:acyl carrier protein [Streptomyces sp. AM 4-1-1]WEH32443.1 acyl carrier protein [Streptomyces sp. AM 4-1-1]